MPDHDVFRSSTTDGLPVAPSLGPTLILNWLSEGTSLHRRRILLISGLAALIASAAALIAQLLTRLIGLITNLAFYGRVSTAFSSPASHHLGAWVIVVPVIGGLIVGLMARFGSQAIRGHGIPEAMEQVLFNQSRIPPRLTFLKPLSAAVSIGTGGPFGAEGPIIATGGALGSLIGQLTRTTADERKTLLAAGAAAGMAAIFGSPVSAVLLSIELLLFEYKAASFIPVALASTIAAGIRMALEGARPVFAMPNLSPPGGAAIAAYIVLGAIVGVASVFVTRAIYAVEDLFDHLPVHWMWWPAIGGVAVGLVGYWAPLTMGVGYDNITSILAGSITGKALLMLCVMKFVSWAIALGSGTSGGTLAPLFTLGGALGAMAGALGAMWLPQAGIDPRMAGLVGMAAIFAGASQALLASVVFAFETTLQPFGLLPLLGGCSVAYLTSRLLMRNSIMTEKIARRGYTVPADYVADPLASVLVRDHATREVAAISASMAVSEVRKWLLAGGRGSGHSGFPLLDSQGSLVGVITLRDLDQAPPGNDPPVSALVKRPAVTITETSTVRDAVNLMVTEHVGRLPVVRMEDPRKVVGILTRSDLLSAYASRLELSRRQSREIVLRPPRPLDPKSPAPAM